MTNTNYKIVHLTERPCKMLDITTQCVQKYETYGERLNSYRGISHLKPKQFMCVVLKIYNILTIWNQTWHKLYRSKFDPRPQILNLTRQIVLRILWIECKYLNVLTFCWNKSSLYKLVEVLGWYEINSKSY